MPTQLRKHIECIETPHLRRTLKPTDLVELYSRRAWLCVCTTEQKRDIIYLKNVRRQGHVHLTIVNSEASVSSICLFVCYFYMHILQSS